ncbi:alpha/beta fold hydrolase [Kineococcus terrestris]|uniref:alpha/beta fold hydrolase n=1 Tax=Kineococcus terrestris TaxID=2044856 RepID=UPI0034DB74BC
MSGRGAGDGRLERYERTGAAGRLVFDVDDSGPVGAPAGGLSSGPGHEPVVCLHGFPADRTSWTEVAGLLVPHGLRVLRPDQRGYSPGARPAGRRAYALDELVGDVLALLDAVGARRCHLVGHDWGGAVAWRVAAHHPDRVASLTAVSTPHPAGLPGRSPAQVARSSYVGFFQLPRVPEALLGGDRLRRRLEATGLPPAHAQRYAVRAAEPGALSAWLGWYRALPWAGRATGPVPADVPVTFVSGARDPFFARSSVAGTGAHVRGAYRHVTVDGGHWLPERHAGVVAEEVLRAVRGG